jgi:hypothetical protein
MLSAPPFGMASRALNREIEQGELELARVDLDRAASVGNHDLDGDIVAERAAEHVLELGKLLAEIDDGGGKHLPAREREQLTGETFAAIGRVLNHVEKTRMPFRGQIAPQPLHAAAHDHQEIVEVVGDATCQLSDRLQTLGLPQRGLRGLTALGFGVEPSRAPQRHPNDEQEKQRRRQAEDHMARHGRDPFTADRRTVDASDDVDRKPLELTITDSPFGCVDLGPCDREDAALPFLCDRGAQTAAGLEAPIGSLRITGEKTAVRTDQRVKASRAAADERIEFLEVLRQHGDRDHAVELTISQRTPPAENKERRAKTRQLRREDLADIGTGIAGHLRGEEASLARVKVARYSPQLAGNERPAVPIDEKDRPHLRQRIDDALHALVEARLIFPDVVVGHAAHDFIDFGDGTLDRLKDLKRMLVKDIERALDPVIGDGILMAVVQPARKGKQHDRQHHRRNHHQLQQSNG